MRTKNFLRVIASAAAVGAALSLAAPASAARVSCNAGPGINLTTQPCMYNPDVAGNDNDHIDTVKMAIFEATGMNVDISLYGKSDVNLALFTFNPTGDPDGELIVDWSTVDGTLIKYITVKAAGEFKLYELGGLGAALGTVSTLDMLNNGGRRPGISHISFWTTQTAVPEPSAWALMILGFGAVGGALRASRKQRAALRFS